MDSLLIFLLSHIDCSSVRTPCQTNNLLRLLHRNVDGFVQLDGTKVMVNTVFLLPLELHVAGKLARSPTMGN